MTRGKNSNKRRATEAAAHPQPPHPGEEPEEAQANLATRGASGDATLPDADTATRASAHDAAGIAADIGTGVRPKTADNVDVLVVARFATTAQAAHAYDELSDAQSEGKVGLDGLVVVAADDKGKVHVEKLVDHSTKKGFSLGLVGAIVAGAFFPATMLAGGVALGLGGAGIGKARNARRRRTIDRELTDVIKPGTSGLVCLTDAFKATRLKRKIRGAQEVRTVAIDEATAAKLRAAKPVAD